MRIGEVIGRVTLSRCHPAVQGATWKLAVTLSKEGILGAETGRSEPFILIDELGTDDGSIIAISDGAEAASPYAPKLMPVDAYCAALIDEVQIDPELRAQLQPTKK